MLDLFTPAFSKCMFYEQLEFLRPVMALTKSWDSISTQKSDLDDSVSLPENELPLKKDSKNYHCREKIRAVNKMCGIHGTRFVCQTSYSLCSTSSGKTGQAQPKEQNDC